MELKIEQPQLIVCSVSHFKFEPAPWHGVEVVLKGGAASSLKRDTDNMSLSYPAGWRSQ